MLIVAEDLKLVRMKHAINSLIADVKTQDFPVDMILLFGSVLTGNFSEYSDIDICIVSEIEPTLRQKSAIENYFSDKLKNELDADFIYCNRQKLMEGTHVFNSIRKEGVILWQHTGK